jgi:hypothetical protein
MHALRRGLPLTVAFGALALGALLLVACDGDGEASADGDVTTTPTATAFVDPGGSDEDYVRVFCTAGLAFEDGMTSAAQELLGLGLDALNDPDVLTDVLVPPIRRYAEELREADPPADVRPFHVDLVQALDAQVQLIETGRFDAEELGDSPFANLVEPPAPIQARLAAVAATVPGCDDGDFFE